MFDQAAVDAIESVIRDLAPGDVKRIPDEDLERGIVTLQRVIDRLQVERLRLVAEVNRRRSFARDGFVSAGAWLAQKSGTTFGTAKRDVVMARALEDMPRTRQALETGELSTAAAHMLVKAREAVTGQFERSEAALVEDAKRLPAGALRSRLSEWVQAADGDAAEHQAERQYERRRLDVFPSASGMVRMDGELDPESGSPVVTALGVLIDVDPQGGRDMRTPAQRRADAIAEICRGWLAGSGRSGEAATRPDVTVIVDVRALERRGGGRCQIPEVGPITPETARRMACDSTVARVVTKGPSEPLEVGRRTPVVSPALRRAVAVRDGGCRFPGCDRPQSWCDAHHVIHWADGGGTGLSNLVLLCRPHHRLAHQGFGIEMKQGAPVFRRPDGSVLEDRASPEGLEQKDRQIVGAG